MGPKYRVSCVAAVLSVFVAAFALPAVVASDGSTEWTVMVYLDGDNNLDPDSVDDITEMMAVGSTDKVTVLALWDRYSEPAYLYKVNQGELELLSGLQVGGKEVNGQEISMADWHVLEAFVDYGKAMFPANHYMLDLWDHGNAFGYACWDDHADPDWATPAKAISLPEVGMALEGSGTMDILTYDGCTIGMIEIANQLSLISTSVGVPIDYLVASEEYIPNQGYAYDNLLGEMNSMHDLSSASVAKMMVDSYAATYSTHGAAKGSSTVGLSMIDIWKIGAASPIIKELVSILEQGLASDFKYYHSLIADARGEANLGWSLAGWDDRVDIGMFLLTLSEKSDDPQIKDLAKQAFDKIVEAVYAGNTQALQDQGAYGLGVWFPNSYKSLGNANTGGFGIINRYTDAFTFATDGGWIDFLFAFWGKGSPT